MVASPAFCPWLCFSLTRSVTLFSQAGNLSKSVRGKSYIVCRSCCFGLICFRGSECSPLSSWRRGNPTVPVAWDSWVQSTRSHSHGSTVIPDPVGTRGWSNIGPAQSAAVDPGLVEAGLQPCLAVQSSALPCLSPSRLSLPSHHLSFAPSSYQSHLLKVFRFVTFILQYICSYGLLELLPNFSSY